MLKRDVKEMVQYLIGERKSFKVTFANGKVEVVEYRGYCWVLGNKGYSNEELIKKMIKFQDNASKFIIRLEVIEEVNEIEEDIEKSLVEEVENLTDDLFQEEDLLYCEEAIERESNNIKGENKMTNYQKAIKVRKVCETQNVCERCKYYDYCKNHFYIRFTPLDVNIKDLATVIKDEKWNIK